MQPQPSQSVVTPESTGEREMEAQRALAAALSHWLYQSVSATGVKAAVRNRALVRVQPLMRCASTFRAAGLTVPLHVLHPVNGRIPARAFAAALASLYRVWGERRAPERGVPVALPESRAFASWLLAGGAAPRYAPVKALQRLLRGTGDSLFLRGIVHGSVATLDDVPGFSDLDLAFIVRHDVLTDADRLLELRDTATDIQALAYAFDPFMHHGPFYIAEADCDWYPEASFPPVLFSFGVELLSNPAPVQVRIRGSDDVTDELLDNFETFFERRASRAFRPQDLHEVEWVLGNAMILPALYLQRVTGEHRYKRDTFTLAAADFSAAEWEPIRLATDARSRLGERPTPSAALVATARRLRWPGLLQRWGVRSAGSRRLAAETAALIPPEFCRMTLDLLRAMRRRIGERTGAPEAIPAAEPGRPYIRGLRDAPVTEPPLRLTVEDYESAVELIVGQWSRLDAPPMSIYQLGRVGAPGISDLDFVVVYPDDARIDWRQFRPDAFPDRVRQLMTHPPYVCTRSSWTELPMWFPVFDLQHRWGEPLPAPAVPQEFAAGVAFGTLIDFLLVKVPEDLLRLAWERPVRIRTLLCVLHSLRYTFELARAAGVQFDEDTETHASRVAALRHSWLERGDGGMAELEELAADGCDLIGSLYYTIDRELRREIGQPLPARALAGRFPTYTFREDWRYEDALRAAYESRLTGGGTTWEFPASFAEVLAFYAAHDRGGVPTTGAGAKVQAWDGGRWRAGLEAHAAAMTRYRVAAARLGVPAQKYIALGHLTGPSEQSRNGRGAWQTVRLGARYAVRPGATRQILKSKAVQWLTT